MVELWVLADLANAVMVVVYGLLAATMLRGVVKGRQWRTNPLATATAGIFLTCTAGHGLHILHTLGWFTGASPMMQEHARQTMGDPFLLAWDVFTAGVAIYYYAIRSRLQLVFEGAALCEDLERRQAQAQELHDNVVQGLVQAKLALDLGHRDEGERAVAATLDSAKAIITGLLGPGAAKVKPGTLRRKAHA